MLAQLSEGETNVSTLSKPYKISQPAISKHLRVLEQAGLVERRRSGRNQLVRVKPEKAQQAVDWLTHYTQFWADQFNAVELYLQRNNKKQGGKDK